MPRQVPLRLHPDPRIERRLLLGIFVVGVVLFSWPFETGWRAAQWAKELRQIGVRQQILMYDMKIEDRGSRNSSITMFFRYEFAGRTIETEMPCSNTLCLDDGTTVDVWINPDDPTDFVTAGGKLSGHRGYYQGAFGFVGAIMTAGGIIIGSSRWFEHRRGRRARRSRDVDGAGGTGAPLGRAQPGTRARFRLK